MEIWKHIEGLAGKTLKTLDQGKAFDVVRVTHDAVIVSPHVTGIQRRIERESLEGAFGELSLRGELSRARIQQQYADWNSAFVAALLATIPGVTTQLKPVRLFRL